MLGSTESSDRPTGPWHAQAGDLLGDNYNLFGLIVCGLGMIALACTLTAAGYGLDEYTQAGAIATAALWILGGGALLVAHRHEEVIERKYGRLGHAPGNRRPVRYSMARPTDDSAPESMR